MREEDRLGIGWGEIGNLRKFASIDAIAAAITKRNARDPEHMAHRKTNAWHGSHSLWAFGKLIKPGNLVIISGEIEKLSQRILVVEVLGHYQYVRPTGPRKYRHVRKARIVDGMDPNELYRRAGYGLSYNISFRTLDRCVKQIE
jgi:hypothetical protein